MICAADDLTSLVREPLRAVLNDDIVLLKQLVADTRRVPALDERRSLDDGKLSHWRVCAVWGAACGVRRAA